MQEPTSFDPCENITWDEQLELMDKEQLIKYVLHLEKKLLEYESQDDASPWWLGLGGIMPPLNNSKEWYTFPLEITFEIIRLKPRD